MSGFRSLDRNDAPLATARDRWGRGTFSRVFPADCPLGFREVVPTTSAWIAAAGALLGALIGGAITGLLQHARERRSEKAAARIGARAVIELWVGAMGRLDADLKHDQWWPYDMPLDVWPEFRVAIAAELRLDEWQLVHAAELRLAVLQRWGDELPAGFPRPSSDAEVFAEIQASQRAVNDAALALVRLADDPPLRRLVSFLRGRRKSQTVNADEAK